MLMINLTLALLCLYVFLVRFSQHLEVFQVMQSLWPSYES